MHLRITPFHFCVSLLGFSLACGDGSASSGGEGGAASSGEGATGPGSTGPGESTSASSGGGGTGAGSMLGDCRIFPPDNPWNQDVSQLELHPDSDAFIDSIGRNQALHPDFGTEWEGAPIGIPYVTVDSSHPMVPVEYTAYGNESDPGPFPVPADAPVEGGPSSDGDRHVIVIDTDTCQLYELYRAFPADGGSRWLADSGAAFDLSINDHHPDGWTSADAAGLPIFPGLARYDEIVEKGELTHALRFTVERSQRGYIFPARHFASTITDPTVPPMGLRLRMKASYDCSAYSQEVQVICAGLKKYGMIVADNGSDWFISGAPDSRWSDANLRDLKSVTGDAFEVVYTGEVVR
jgi:hypothetical protein